MNSPRLQLVVCAVCLVCFGGVLASTSCGAGLVVPPARASQPEKTSEDTLVAITLPHEPPNLKDSKFTFSVRYTSELAGKHFASPFVNCGQSVSCDSTGTKPGRGFSVDEYVATLPGDPPAVVEITAILSLHTNNGDQEAQRASKIVDLGFSKYMLEPNIDLREPLPGDSPKRMSFHLKDAAGTVIPVLPILVKLSSDCVDFSNEAHPEERGKLVSGTTVQFENDHRVSEEVIVQPHFWQAETCEVKAVEILQGNGISIDMEPPSIIFKVKPAYLPSFLMALLGAFCQYVVFGTARLISEAQKQNPANPTSQTALALQGVAGKDSGEGAHLAGDAQQPSGAVSAAVQPPANSGSKISVEFFRLKEHLAPIFIGPAYSNILSVLLKGILAFFVAGIMKDPNLFGITVDKGNFYGFFTLGVFFGFWPLEKLLQKFAEIAGINTPQSQLPDKGTAGTQPAVSGG